MSTLDKTVETESRFMFFRGLRGQMEIIWSDLKWVRLFNGSYLFLLCKQNNLELDSDDEGITL